MRICHWDTFWKRVLAEVWELNDRRACRLNHAFGVTYIKWAIQDWPLLPLSTSGVVPTHPAGQLPNSRGKHVAIKEEEWLLASSPTVWRNPCRAPTDEAASYPSDGK